MPSSFQVKNQTEETSADYDQYEQRELFIGSNSYGTYDFCADKEVQTQGQIP